ncbi:MAG: sugar-binding transcriptional regulator [Spirochaetales bacterium]|nr:sugar-binding transcriptional regulator [Spirochaetales bacterium]
MFERKRKLVKIAYSYYKAGMTQEQIANKFHMSRQHVNKLVNSLIEEGIVNITINGLENENVALENLIEQKFDLNQVLIADTEESDLPILTVLGKKAGEFLDDFIQNGDKIGVSWGLTLGETIQYIRPSNKAKCDVVQLVGGVNTSNHSIQPDEIARMLASKFGCDYSILYAPATMDRKLVQEVAKQDFYKKTFERISECNIAMMGIGELSEKSTIVTEGYLSREDYKMLIDSGYVGDICFNHFKLDGDFGTVHLHNRVMGVDISMLKKIQTVVAIAGGASKADAVYGALKTGCIDVLVIDTSIAKELEKKLQ